MHRENFEPVGCGAWNTTVCPDDPASGSNVTYRWDYMIGECFESEFVAGTAMETVVQPLDCCMASDGTDALALACMNVP